MKKLIKCVLIALFSLLTLSAIGLYWVYQSVVSYGQMPLKLEAPVEFEVARGTSFSQMANTLAQTGAVDELWKLKLLVKLRPELAKIRSGLYQISPNDTVVELLEKLRQGKEMVFTVTLVEGQSIKEWREQLKQLPRLKWKEGAFLEVLEDNGDKSKLPEGKFYPDTYHYGNGDSVKVILQQSYQKMQRSEERV